MQYFKTTTIINGEGEQVATLEDIELTADEVIEVLAAQVDVKEVTPLPKEKKKGKVLKVKEAKFVPGKKRSGKKTVIDSQIYQVLDLKKQGKTIKEMAEEAGLSVSTVYRITSGALKPEGKRVVNTETPTKVGEREIDKKPAMLTDTQYTEAKEAFDDGMTAGSISFTMQLDLDEVRRAVKCDNYTEYTAKY